MSHLGAYSLVLSNGNPAVLPANVTVPITYCGGIGQHSLAECPDGVVTVDTANSTSVARVSLMGRYVWTGGQSLCATAYSVGLGAVQLADHTGMVFLWPLGISFIWCAHRIVPWCLRARYRLRFGGREARRLRS